MLFIVLYIVLFSIYIFKISIFPAETNIVPICYIHNMYKGCKALFIFIQTVNVTFLLQVFVTGNFDNPEEFKRKVCTYIYIII